MKYAVKLTLVENEYLVSARDLPGMNSCGDTVEEALKYAIEAMTLVLQYCIDQRQPFPEASDKRVDEYWVELSASSAAKARLYEAVRACGLRKSELARMLRLPARRVVDLMDLTRPSRVDPVLRALAMLTPVSEDRRCVR